MTLNDFCTANPQLVRPTLMRCELIDKTKKMDLQRLHDTIHTSNFLMSRRSLVWVLNTYEDILVGKYNDFPYYHKDKSSSQRTANERHYAPGELDHLMTDIDDVDF